MEKRENVCVCERERIFDLFKWDVYKTLFEFAFFCFKFFVIGIVWNLEIMLFFLK